MSQNPMEEEELDHYDVGSEQDPRVRSKRNKVRPK